MGQIFPLGLPGLGEQYHLIHKLNLAARDAAASSVQPTLLQPLNVTPSQMLPYVPCPNLQLPCLPNKLSGSLTFHFASLHLLYSSWSLSSSLSWLDFPLPCSLAQRGGLPCLLLYGKLQHLPDTINFMLASLSGGLHAGSCCNLSLQTPVIFPVQTILS